MSKKDGFLPDDPDIGCGYEKFKTNDEHDPFFTACAYHDFVYGHRPKGISRKVADKQLLERCLEVAGDNPYLKVRAYIYYGFARTFGGLFW